MKRFFLGIIILVTAFIAGCSTDSLLNEEGLDGQSIADLEHVEYFRTGALEHILVGELNKKGQAVGFHYEGIQNSNGEVVEGTETKPDEHGIYEAKVIVMDVEKQSNHGKSTFFPIEWYAQDVIDAINEAYESKQLLTGNTYAGVTEEGIVIHMYLDQADKIISAFPIYERR